MNLEGQDISKGVLLPLGNKAEKASERWVRWG